MKQHITKKQQKEIDFLSKVWSEPPFEPTEEEIKHFIEWTVYGKNKENFGAFTGEKVTTNRLFLNKRSLEIMTKMWREDIKNGLMTKEELIEDYDGNEYIIKIIKQL